MEKAIVRPKHTFNEGIFMFATKSDLPLTVVGVLFMVLASLGSPSQAYIYGKIFLKLSEFLMGNYNSVGDFLDDIRSLCLGIVAIGLGRMFLTWISISVWLIIGERHQNRARELLLTLILRKDLVWFESKKDLMGTIAQVNRSIEEVRSGISENLATLIQSMSLIIFLFINAMVSLWSLTLVIIASGPVMAFSTYIFGRKTFKFQKRENDLGGNASNILDWSFVNGDLVRLLNGKYVDMVAFNKIVDLSAEAFNLTAFCIAGNASVLRLLANCIFVQGFLFGTFLMNIGKLTIDLLFTAFSSCLLFGVQISAIASIVASLNIAKAAACTINSLDLIIPQREFENDELAFKTISFHKKSIIHSITLQNVSFTYQTGNCIVLKDISTLFDSSGINFIFGESGSGKSTLALLLLSFYSPTKGSIVFGDVLISELTPLEILDDVTLVETSPFIFDDLISGNLRVHHKPISDLKLKEACVFARLEQFVNSQPHGFHSMITSASLSGGQMQKIGLARAWLKDPQVLILDESLSAIDIVSRKEILDDIRRWRRGKITIYITHKPLEIEDSDKVIVLDRGEVKFQGLGRELPKDQFDEQMEQLQPLPSSSESIFTVSKTKARFITCDYLHNPPILRDLEEKGQMREPRSTGTLEMIQIVKFCFATIYSKIWISVGLVFSLVSGLATPILSFCVSKLLSTAIAASYDDRNNSLKMLKWCIIMIAVSVADGIIYFVSHSLLQLSLERWIVDLRKNLLAIIDEQDMSFFRELFLKPAEITALLMNDSRDLRVLVSEFLSTVILMIALTLFGVTWSIVSGWKLALVGVAFVPLTLIVTVIFGTILATLETSYKDKVAAAENFIHDAVTGIRTIRAFGIETRIRADFIRRLDEITRIGKKRAILTGLGEALLEFITSIATGTILYYGLSLVAANQYNQGQFVQVLTILTFTLTSASSLMYQLPEITRGKRAALKFHWLSNLEKLFIETNGSAQIHRTKGVTSIIKFDDVEFSFADQSTSNYNKVLSNISFEFQMGQTVALVGKSGSGKSTIVQLLGRLYEPDRGKISYFNQMVSDLDVEWYRESVVIVSQHPRFFEGSILRNLTYGIRKSEINEEMIWNRLEQCQIADFVRSLPEGLNSVIGEGANIKASMGQLQRLNICRGLIRNPKVLILDECTSNLDETISSSIIELICNQLQLGDPQLTVIMITHDVKIMKAVSRIMMVSKGKIVEDGTFDVLYQRKREFYNLIK